MSYQIEYVTKMYGFIGVIAMMDLGHRCAYIGIPKNHMLYGVNYNDIDINVHGGLSFSSRCEGENYPLMLKDIWWIGWDYGHFNDYNDWKSFLLNFDLDIIEKRSRTIINDLHSPFYKQGKIYMLRDVVLDLEKAIFDLRDLRYKRS